MRDVVVLCVCLSVYRSVPALAASASVETSTHGFLLGFSLISMCGVTSVQKLWRDKEMTHSQPLSRSFRTNETQQLPEGQLVGLMLLHKLATGATGVKQARYRRGPTRGSEALVRACAVYTQGKK